MRAVVIHEYLPGLDHFVIEERPLPTPGAGEVVVQVAASPLNPSDLMFVQGMYGIRKNLPIVPGFEAGGTITAVGAGVDPARVGQRVACFAGAGDGTWQEYMVTTEGSCLPIPDDLTTEQAAMLLVNPLTAYAMIERAAAMGATAFVQTAAASVLGQMMLRLATERGMGVINVVRRPDQVALLQAAGAQYILDSTEPTFEKHLREACRTLGARLAFDAVGGELTGQVLRGLPNGGTAIVYGGLAGPIVSVGVDQFIFRNKHVEGFWLSSWMNTAPPAVQMAGWLAVCAGAGTVFRSEVRARYPFDQVAAAAQSYAAQMTGGKVVLTGIQV